MLPSRFRSKPAPEMPKLNGVRKCGGRRNAKLVRLGTLPDVTFVALAKD